MEISVLGPLALDTQTSPVSPRDRVVLAALATRPGRPITTDLLTDALWGTDPPASATKVLQGCVSRLRRALGADAVETVPGGYRLTVAGDQLDAVRFERTLARARELDAVGESDRAAYLLGEALELWRGRPFEDLEDWEPAVTEAARLEELRQEAEELRVSTHLAAGHAREVVADADRLVRAAPLRERRWELLAQAQYQSGRQADALHTVHQARAMLVQRLGIDPGPELAGLEQAILRQDESLMGAWSGQRQASGRCPYKGLMAFDLVDAESFVGRDHDLRTCLDIVRRQGVLAVVGPSGYGKSSLLRAGVAAALVDEGDRVVVMTPGTHPSAALADAWGARGADTLVVDQLEELFTMCEDPSARSAFVEELADLAQERRVLMGLRADRMSDLGAYPRLARMVERGLHLLGPMDAESLRAVIEAPARQHGLLLEPGLVDLLVREVEGEPGALPMLSYALQETWRRREGHTLTVAGYQASGGIRGAVAQAAEALYKQVETVRRPVLRDVLMRLVAPGPDSQPVRTRVPRQLVAGDPGQEELVDALIEARLVTSSEGLVEIAHESLTRAWPRLRAWLDDDIEGLRIRHHLLEAAGAWDSLGRPTSEVYRGTRLDQAVEWRESARAELTALERDFLDAGTALAESERESLIEHARTQARMVRRLRGVVGVGAVLLVLSLVAGFLAVRQTGVAETNATSARRAEAVAEARLLAARAVNIDEPVPALALAIEAVQRDDSAATRSALSAVMDKRRGLSETTPLLEPTRDDTGLQLSPDGTRLATLGRDGRVSIIDADTMQVLRNKELPNPGGDWAITANLTNIEFAPPDTIDARSDLFVGMPLMSDDPLWILDGQTLKARKARLRMLPERAIVADLDFSEDGRYLAAAFHLPGADAPPGYPIDSLNVADQVRIWDLLHPKRAPRIMRRRRVSDRHQQRRPLSLHLEARNIPVRGSKYSAGLVPARLVQLRRTRGGRDPWR